MARPSRTSWLWSLGALLVAGVAGAWPLAARRAAAQDMALPQLALTVEQAAYAPGEPVRLTLTLDNPSPDPILLSYTSGQRYDVVVQREGVPVWRWSAGRLFIQVIGEQELAPGATQTATVLWPQTGEDGQPVEPGTYTVTARWVSSPGAEADPVDVEIGGAPPDGNA